jgi:hypothetical protein
VTSDGRLRAVFLFESSREVNLAQRRGPEDSAAPKFQFNGAGELQSYIRCMDTLAVATIHDHWAEDTVSDHGLVALKLFARHLAKRHPIAIDILEWSFSIGLAVFVTVATLIVSA